MTIYIVFAYYIYEARGGAMDWQGTRFDLTQAKEYAIELLEMYNSVHILIVSPNGDLEALYLCADGVWKNDCR